MNSRQFKAVCLAFSRVAASLSVLFCYGMLSRWLSKEEYATLRQLTLTYKAVLPFAAMGIPAALMYFLPKESDHQRSIVIKSLIALSTTGGIFFLYIVLGGNQFLAGLFNNPALAPALSRYSPYFLLAIPLSIATPCLIATGRTLTSVVVSLVGVLLYVLIVLVIAASHPTALDISSGLVLHVMIMLPLVLFLIFQATKGSAGQPQKLELRSILAYSIPLGLGTMVATLTIYVDKFVVAAFLPPFEFAIYVNGATEVPLIGAVTGAAAAVILPEMVAKISSGNSHGALDLWKGAAVKSAWILFPVTSVLWVLAPYLIVLLFGEDYQNSTPIFRIYLLIVPIRIAFFSLIYQGCGKSGLLLRRCVLALVLNAVFSIPMVIYFGAIGAALTTVIITWAVMVPYNCFETSRLLGVRVSELFDLKRLLRVALGSFAMAAILVVVSSILHFSNLASLVILGLTTLLILPVLYLIFAVWTIDDVRTLSNQLRQKLSRK